MKLKPLFQLKPRIFNHMDGIIKTKEYWFMQILNLFFYSKANCGFCRIACSADVQILFVKLNPTVQNHLLNFL